MKTPDAQLPAGCGRRRPGRAPAALLLLLLLLGSWGCGTPARPAKPAPEKASSPPSVDELDLVTMPVTLNLESKLGVNGVPVKVYAIDYRRPKAQPIHDGTIEVLMFEGLVGDGFDQTNRCRHVWSFPARDLPIYAATTTVGTGYRFPLAWGKDQPRADRITLVARFQTPQGQVVYSAPSYIAIPPAPVPPAPPPASTPPASAPPSSSSPSSAPPPKQ
jgi:hypothetical protein